MMADMVTDMEVDIVADMEYSIKYSSVLLQFSSDTLNFFYTCEFKGGTSSDTFNFFSILVNFREATVKKKLLLMF